MQHPQPEPRDRSHGDISMVGAVLIGLVLVLAFFAFARGF